jgi:23S rRNA (cytosine1962-C5)-methyltransferase
VTELHWAELAFRDFDPARILYEDDDLIAVDKPAGVPCQAPDAMRPHDLPSRLKRFLAARRGVSVDDVYLGTHQRLDAESSGVIVYALRPSANPGLAAQFESREVQKRYVAAVGGKPPAKGAELVDWLAPEAGGRMRVVRGSRPGAKQAKSAIEKVRRNGERSWLQIRIDTGRTHQIRVQLAERGCPLVGDALYGGARAFRLMLHSESLALKHPATGAPLEIRAPVPAAFEDWLAHGVRPAFRDSALFGCALDHACQRRFSEGRALAAGITTAFRLLHEEGDGVPGFGVDVYDRYLVVRVRADAPAEDEEALLSGLDRLGASGVYFKRHPKQANEMKQASDDRAAPSTPVRGAAAPESLIVYEQGVPFEVQLHEGLRTGLFLDQRDNRRRIGEIARDKRVLNLFAYTGSFSVAALSHGAAHVTTVDVSRAALRQADRNVARIGASDRHRSIAQDAFDALEMLARRGERFDVIICDPPSYATTKRGRFRVTKDYVSLCRAALQVIAADGVLLACLNHYGISQAALRKFVQSAVQAQGLHLQSMRDTPAQVDFPTAGGAEPPTKSVMARLRSNSLLQLEPGRV